VATVAKEEQSIRPAQSSEGKEKKKGKMATKPYFGRDLVCRS